MIDWTSDRSRLRFFLRSGIAGPVERADARGKLAAAIVLTAVAILLSLMGCSAHATAAAAARRDFPGCAVEDDGEAGGLVCLRVCGLPRAYLVTPVQTTRVR